MFVYFVVIFSYTHIVTWWGGPGGIAVKDLILETISSFSVLTLLVRSFDPWKTHLKNDLKCAWWELNLTQLWVHLKQHKKFNSCTENAQCSVLFNKSIGHMLAEQYAVNWLEGASTKCTSSSEDDIANVNFYNGTVHVIQNKIDSRINSATGRRSSS